MQQGWQRRAVLRAPAAPVRGTRPPSATRGPLVLTNAYPHVASARKFPTANHQSAAHWVERLCSCTRSQPVAGGASSWST